MSADDRAPLSRERILTAAIAVADADGIAALTMRRLGGELGVEAMSLYNHVANKDALLDGLVEHVIEEMDLPRPGDDWDEAILRRAASARDVFRRHPWAMGLLEQRSANSSPNRLAYYDAVLGSMLEAGFDIEAAVRAFSIVDAYIFGFILQELALPFDDADSLDEVGTDLLEQMAEAFPHLTEATRHAMENGWDYAIEFRFGLDLIIDGIRRLRDG